MPSALLCMMALPIGLDSLIGPVFASGILAVIEIVAFFAKLPFADTALLQPGHVVLMLLVGGVPGSCRLGKPMQLAGWGLAIFAVLL